MHVNAKPEILTTFTAPLAGLQAQVYLGALGQGFGVRLLDLDADEVVPCFKFFPARYEAESYASFCVANVGDVYVARG